MGSKRDLPRRGVGRAFLIAHARACCACEEYVGGVWGVMCALRMCAGGGTAARHKLHSLCIARRQRRCQSSLQGAGPPGCTTYLGRPQPTPHLNSTVPTAVEGSMGVNMKKLRGLTHTTSYCSTLMTWWGRKGGREGGVENGGGEGLKPNMRSRGPSPSNHRPPPPIYTHARAHARACTWTRAHMHARTHAHADTCTPASSPSDCPPPAPL